MSDKKGLRFPEGIEAKLGEVKVVIENYTDKPPEKPQEPTPAPEGERTKE